LIKGFQDGIVPGLADKATMRNFLAKKLGCLTKRISKKYEKSGYNGRLQYRSGVLPLEPEELKKRQEELVELEKKFRESRAAIVELRESNGAGSKKSNAKTNKSPESASLTGPADSRVAVENAALGLAGLAAAGSSEVPERSRIEEALLQQSMQRTAAAARTPALTGLPAWTVYQRSGIMGLSTDPLLGQNFTGGLGDTLLGQNFTGGLGVGAATPYDLLALRAARARQQALFPSSLVGLGSFAALPHLSALERNLAHQRQSLALEAMDPSSIASRQSMLQAMLDAPAANMTREEAMVANVLGHKAPMTTQQEMMADLLRRKRELGVPEHTMIFEHTTKKPRSHEA
jgi:hypothetical protein